MDESLLIGMTPKILVFCIEYDDDMKCNTIYVSNPETADKGYLIDGYSHEEQLLVDKMNCLNYWEAQESMFDMPDGKTKDQVINELKALGLEYRPGFLQGF